MGEFDGSSVELTNDVLKLLPPNTVATLTEIQEPYSPDADGDGA